MEAASSEVHQDPALRLLIVDDNQDDRLFLHQLLKPFQNLFSDIADAESAHNALSMVAAFQPNCILLDYNLPDSNGFDLLHRLTALTDAGSIAIVFLTGMGNEKLASDAVKFGAHEYLAKDELTADKLKSTIESAIRSARTQNQLRRLTHYDSLTGLFNRNLFMDRLTHALCNMDRSGNTGALLFLDVDHFKGINDSFGHHVGDCLLKEFAERIQASIRASDTAARMGGDEFVILLENTSHEHCIFVANKLKCALAQMFTCEGAVIQVTASIGMACFPNDASTSTDLLCAADHALYQAKRQGRNTVCSYDASECSVQARRKKIREALPLAISNNEITLHFQPIFFIPQNTISHYEALARWHSDALGPVPPGEFIPIIEQEGLSATYTHWLLEHACKQISDYSSEQAPIKVAINLSVGSLHNHNFPDLVASVLKKYQIHSNQLLLEISEASILKAPEKCSYVIQQLSQMGIGLSIDDLGTGQSVLKYLVQLPLQSLKIDRSFIQNNQNNKKVIDAILALAKTLGVHAVAEGIETDEQYQFACKNECQLGQGFLLGKPRSKPQTNN